MRDDVRQALAIGRSTTLEERTIDITTTGRRSGVPRRIEIVFYRFDDSVYLSGIPRPRPRAWLLNLTAEPHFIFHLKHGVVADLPATATVITDLAERRRILSDFVDEFNQRRGPDSQWPEGVLEDWVARSPLAKVSFEEATNERIPMEAHLSSHHRDTVERLFSHPPSRNIEWRDVVSLLETIGSVKHEHNGKLRVTLGPETEVLPAPHGKDVDVQIIVDLRRMLEQAGFGSDGSPAVTDQRARDHGDGQWGEPT